MLWIAAIALIMVGVAGTVLPALPGAILVFGGIALAAWIDDFARIPAWLLLLLAALTVLASAVDYVAGIGLEAIAAHEMALLGASPDDARALAVAYWRTVYPAMPDGYRSTACRPGGTMDEHLPDAPWAPAGA